METRRFGQTGLTVPVIGMGTWQTFDVSGERALQVRKQIVIEALRVGMNFFDSSPMYGEAEQVLAEALGPRRSEAIIATKVWSQTVSEGKHQIARALRFYGEHVEVYQIHNLLAWDAYLPLLEEMKKRGETDAVGVTHYSHAAFAEIRRIVETGRIDAIQIPYNVLDRAVDQELLPLAEERALGVIVMKPLGVGRLVDYEPPREQWEHLESFGVSTWAQVLLKWIASDPRVSVVIPATSKPEHAAENARAGQPPFFDPDTREAVARLAARYA